MATEALHKITALRMEGVIDLARENSFTFIGQVVNVPIVLLNEESNNYRITFTLLVVRRNGRTDYPKINVYDLSEQEARDYVQMMRPGVFAIIRGMIATSVVILTVNYLL